MKGKWFIGLILLFLMIAGTIPPLSANPALAVGGEAEITGSTVNIRSGPGLSYSVSGALEKGRKSQLFQKAAIGWKSVPATVLGGSLLGWPEKPAALKQTKLPDKQPSLLLTT
ncbi:hypothetical protein [Planococcus koreensis]|uniref:hypothetical protein n=1 Tax=Planococcus koreensis TaxID=112331 RepID=UPI0039FDA967